MKKGKKELDELRPEYRREDFGTMVRGKYAQRMREATNIIVLDPDIAEAFPNEEAVNNALLSLVDIAQKITRPTRRSTGNATKRSSR